MLAGQKKKLVLSCAWQDLPTLANSDAKEGPMKFWAMFSRFGTVDRFFFANPKERKQNMHRIPIENCAFMLNRCGSETSAGTGTNLTVFGF